MKDKSSIGCTFYMILGWMALTAWITYPFIKETFTNNNVGLFESILLFFFFAVIFLSVIYFSISDKEKYPLPIFTFNNLSCLGYILGFIFVVVWSLLSAVMVFGVIESTSGFIKVCFAVVWGIGAWFTPINVLFGNKYFS
jgi:hypothetical protein